MDALAGPAKPQRRCRCHRSGGGRAGGIRPAARHAGLCAPAVRSGCHHAVCRQGGAPPSSGGLPAGASALGAGPFRGAASAAAGLAVLAGARAVARHTRAQGPSDLRALESSVRASWREQMQSTGIFSQGSADAQKHRMRALLDQWAGPPPLNDPAAQLHGVRYLPWADWPERLQGPRVESAFWQQDAEGRFFGAANRLQKLWGGSP